MVVITMDEIMGLSVEFIAMILIACALSALAYAFFSTSSAKREQEKKVFKLRLKEAEGIALTSEEKEKVENIVNSKVYWGFAVIGFFLYTLIGVGASAVIATAYPDINQVMFLLIAPVATIVAGVALDNLLVHNAADGQMYEKFTAPAYEKAFQALTKVADEVPSEAKTFTMEEVQDVFAQLLGGLKKSE